MTVGSALKPAKAEVPVRAMIIVSAYALTLRVDVVDPDRFFRRQHSEAQVGTSYHTGPRQKQRE